MTYAKNGVYTDIPLTCVDCNQPYVFEVGEQQFFEKKGLKDMPKRCKPCRQKRKDAREAKKERERTPEQFWQDAPRTDQTNKRSMRRE